MNHDCDKQPAAGAAAAPGAGAYPWEPFRPIRPEDGVSLLQPCGCCSSERPTPCRSRREYISWHVSRKLCVAACREHILRQEPEPLENPPASPND